MTVAAFLQPPAADLSPVSLPFPLGGIFRSLKLLQYTLDIYIHSRPLSVRTLLSVGFAVSKFVNQHR